MTAPRIRVELTELEAEMAQVIVETALCGETFPGPDDVVVASHTAAAARFVAKIRAARNGASFGSEMAARRRTRKRK